MAVSRLASSSSSSSLAKLLLRPLSAPPFSRPFSAAASDDNRTVLTIEMSVSFTGHRIDPPSRSIDTNRKELLSFFCDMSVMCHMEIAADSIGGFYHLYDGQEAVSIGMEAAITKRDSIITTFLGRGYCC